MARSMIIISILLACVACSSASRTTLELQQPPANRLRPQNTAQEQGDSSRVNKLRMQLAAVQRELGAYSSAPSQEASALQTRRQLPPAPPAQARQQPQPQQPMMNPMNAYHEIAMVQLQSQTHQVPPDLSVRPGAATNVQDIIKFGIYAKTFYGADMKAQSFTIDSIITLQWTDSRVVALVPAGSASLTMSDAVANARIWLPGVEITNRDMSKYEIISTAVTVGTDGTVTKVERSLTTVKNKFDFNNYPVDHQNLAVKIASSTYMLEEVKLAPIDDPAVSGYKEGLIAGGFDQTDFKITEFEETDGALRKSRGVMTIGITRNLDKYWQAVLVPSVLYLMISWGVFWFPFLPPFIMPRLVLSIIALLTFTTLSAKSGAAIPPASPYNWNDLFCQTVQFLMVITAGLNIFTEGAFHSLKCTETAKSINKECRILAPLMTISTMLLIVTNTGPKGLSLGVVSVAVQIILAIWLIVYFWWCAQRLTFEKMQNDEKAAGGS